ncbi:MAG: CoA-binding protein [Chloroflexi bacterium]|nr:CoA-binding protein [Chloroflexota bacterium]
MPFPYTRQEIIQQMQRIFTPRGVAIVGASSTPGKLGYAIVDNLKNGGYEGHVYPVNPGAAEILGYRVYPSLDDVPDDTDVALVSIPAKSVAGVVASAGAKGIAGLVIISSGFAETGEIEMQNELAALGREHGVRIMGPNIYGYYYTHAKLCATFCTPYTERGGVALTSQSGGVGMAILGYSRSRRMGVSAIVGLGNKCDIGEADLLEFFGQDPNTEVIAMHMEDLKDGKAFMEAASRVSREKPIVVLKAGRTSLGARAAASHTAALAGEDRVYDAAFAQAGVIRAKTLEELLDWSRALQMLPDPEGENVLIITGAGGMGVLLTDACVDRGLGLMTIPKDLDERFKECIPPFGASGNPIDITGGEPPETYRKTITIGLEDPRVHALIVGYWHTILTPPMVFAKVLEETLEEARGKGIHKPVVVALAGDTEVEDAARYLEDLGVPAYPYAVEDAVAALAARYTFWRGRGVQSDRDQG